MRALVLLVISGLAMPLSLHARDTTVDHGRWTDEYDPYFKKYTKRYFGPAFDWRWFKGQAIAESNLRPNIKSDAGAVGLMQILPSTYREIQQSNPHFKDIRDPQWNIAAGIYYDRQLYRKWQKPVSDKDRLLLSLASYNAGYGRIRKAYKRAEAKDEALQGWQNIQTYVPGETRFYVNRIDNLVTGREQKKIRRLRGIEKYLAKNP